MKEIKPLWFQEFEKTLGERDLRYQDKFTSQEKSLETVIQLFQKSLDTAINTLKESTLAALQASDKAIEKAAAAQAQYDFTHNDLVRRMVPKTEHDKDIEDLQGKINRANEDISHLTITGVRGEGVAIQAGRGLAQSNWTIERIITVTIALGGWGVALIAIFK